MPTPTAFGPLPPHKPELKASVERWGGRRPPSAAAGTVLVDRQSIWNARLQGQICEAFLQQARLAWLDIERRHEFIFS